MKNKYLITIQVLDEDTGNIIGKRSTYGTDTASMIIEDIKEWIKKYDDKNEIQCLKCNRYFDENEMESVPNKEGDEKICPECLHCILYNQGQFNE